MRKQVVIESPWGEIEEVKRNIKYVRVCLGDSILEKKEASFALHGFYTQLRVLMMRLNLNES